MPRPPEAPVGRRREGTGHALHEGIIGPGGNVRCSIDSKKVLQGHRFLFLGGFELGFEKDKGEGGGGVALHWPKPKKSGLEAQEEANREATQGSLWRTMKSDKGMSAEGGGGAN